MIEKLVNSVIDGVVVVPDDAIVQSESREVLRIHNSHYADAGIPSRHIEFRPAESTSAVWDECYGKIKKIIDNRGLCVLVGGRGVGKTQSAICAIGYVTHHIGRTALFTKAFTVFLSIRSAEDSQSVINSYLKPYLLVIDAYEVRGETDYEDRIINHIVDMRYDAMSPTIIITNETAEKFKTSAGESVVDRIRESGGAIIFKNNSFRGR